MARGPRQLTGTVVAQALGAALPGVVTASNDEWVEVAPDRVEDALRWLHDSDQFDAAQLSNLTAVDRYDRFEVVYHLQSLDLNHQIALKAIVTDHEDPVLPSAYPVYKGALLQEREVFDLMGIRFANHPDLRRILLWEGFPGHPLRKDWMGMVGGHTSGLRGFPFENKEAPDRIMNAGNLVEHGESLSAQTRRNVEGAQPGQGH
ncbi:MAG: NADH-quinone oxidoreductase subunit C [Dehalococcoidia bacterium]|nr:NADH-quinone oxidoreductase subunit C [Dehalococcoidia bacterium]